MEKKQQLIDFLNEQLFNPIINSPYASSQLKHDFQHTRDMITMFSTEGILLYIWNSLISNDCNMIFSHRLHDEGFDNLNHVLDTFRHEFTYDWLIS